MSKRPALLMVGMVVAMVAWALSAPYRSLVAIRAAAEAGDVEELRDRVDFPAVRESVKEQLRVMMARQTARSAADLEGNPFAAAGAALGSMFADAMVEKMVEAFVSAEGLRQMFQAQVPTAEGHSGPGERAESTARFKSLSRFEARYWSADSPEQAVSLHLRRRGLSWVLTSISFDGLRSDSGVQAAKSDHEAQRETVSKIRTTGTALMAWLVDQTPPAAGRAVVAASDFQLLTLEQVESILVPTYARPNDICSKDGWGHPCEIRVNLGNLWEAEVIMMIRCPGRDGVFSSHSYEPASFHRSQFDEDIVWADGFFTRWPQRSP